MSTLDRRTPNTTEDQDSAGSRGPAATTVEARLRSRLHRLVIAFVPIAILGYLLLVTFPGNYRPIAPALDNGWRYGINFASASHGHLKYGRDVNFSYGPLGYLLEPLDVRTNLVQAVIFWLVMHLLFGWLIWVHFARSRRIPNLVAFGAAYAFSAFGLLYELHLLIVLGLLLLVVIVADGWVGSLAGGGAGALGGACLFMKFSLGLSAAGAIGAVVLYLLVVERGKALRRVAVMSGAYILALVMVTIVFIGSPRNLILWMHTSLDISTGYGEAMTIRRSAEVVFAGLAALGIYAVLVGLLVRWRTVAGILSLVFVIPLMIGFKESFVRHGGQYFFPFLLAVLAVLLLESSNGKHLAWAAGAYAAVVLLMLPTHCRLDPGSGCGRVDDIVLARLGTANIRSAIHLQEVRADLSRTSRDLLQRDRLNSSFLQRIAEDGGSVDVLPWEISYVPANGLRWSPNPVLQTYSDYTTYLDARTAAHLLGPQAPRFLLVRFQSLDRRNPLLDAPAAWRSVFYNYRLVETDLQRHVLLLESRGLPGPPVDAVVRTDVGMFSKWIAVPSSFDHLFARIRLQPRPLGILTRLFWRVDPVFMDLEYASGDERTYRIVPGVTADGMFINQLPRGLNELAHVLDGTQTEHVVRFRIRGPGPLFYRDRFTIVRETPAG